MSSESLQLGVNIDHVATLRQVRKASYPQPIDAARLCAEAGAHGLTVHLREDRRHIQDSDVRAIKHAALLPLNLELGNHPEIVAIALGIRPDEVCLVPERREELTTEGGLDVAGRLEELAPTVSAFGEAGTDVSMFIDPDLDQVEASARIGAPTIELHTGTVCTAPDAEAERETERLVKAAVRAHELGLRVNAGHGINLDNLNRILRIPHLSVLNIGHSIVSRAVMIGMKAAVKEMLEAMAAYRGGGTA